MIVPGSRTDEYLGVTAMTIIVPRSLGIALNRRRGDWPTPRGNIIIIGSRCQAAYEKVSNSRVVNSKAPSLMHAWKPIRRIDSFCLVSL